MTVAEGGANEELERVCSTPSVNLNGRAERSVTPGMTLRLARASGLGARGSVPAMPAPIHRRAFHRIGTPIPLTLADT
jgi:hypothetical protein